MGHPQLRRLLAGAGMVAVAWAGLHRPGLRRLDARAGDALRSAGRGPCRDRVVTNTTDLGSLYAVTGATAVLAAIGRRDEALDVAAVGGLAWTVGQAAKGLVRRARPYEADGVRRLVRPPTGSSFPSGHAAVAAAVAEVLADRARPGRAWPLRVLAVYVAATRVDVGVHYPSDVIGGAGMGVALAGTWRRLRARLASR